MGIVFKKSTEVKLCGGKRFTVYHWPPSQVLRNIPKIGRLVAVPMGTMAGSMMQGGETLHDALPTAILYILDQLDGGNGQEVIDLLLEGIEVDGMGGQIDIDETFDGHVEDLLILLQKVIEVNYGCFFGKSGFGTLAGLFQKLGLVQAVDNLGQTPETPEA